MRDNERRCSHCGRIMYEGYCIDDGGEYYCCESCLAEHYTAAEYEEMYEGGCGYWTEWESDCE